MRLFRMTNMVNRLACGESGLALIETLVALALLGLIAVAFLNGLAATSQATIIVGERTVAESLAQSQMEWAKGVAYSANTTGYSPAPIPDGEDYIGYAAIIDAEPLHSPDDGIQKIAVTVKHYDKEVITLEGYKVDR